MLPYMYECRASYDENYVCRAASENEAPCTWESAEWDRPCALDTPSLSQRQSARRADGSNQDITRHSK